MTFQERFEPTLEEESMEAEFTDEELQEQAHVGIHASVRPLQISVHNYYASKLYLFIHRYNIPAENYYTTQELILIR